MWVMAISFDWRDSMFRNPRVQMAAVLAVGTPLGCHGWHFKYL
jgi:hypothetical protein